MIEEDNFMMENFMMENSVNMCLTLPFLCLDKAGSRRESTEFQQLFVFRTQGKVSNNFQAWARNAEELHEILDSVIICVWFKLLIFCLY